MIFVLPIITSAKIYSVPSRRDCYADFSTCSHRKIDREVFPDSIDSTFRQLFHLKFVTAKSQNLRPPGFLLAGKKPTQKYNLAFTRTEFVSVCV